MDALDPTSSRPRIRLVPFRRGLGMGLVVVAMLAAAINYGNNLIFFLAFMLLALMVNSIWQARRLIRPVRVSTQGPAMRAAGETGTWLVELESPDAIPALQLATANGETDPVLVSLPAGGVTRAEITLPPAPRGYLPLPPLMLRTHYPLGLWQAERAIEPDIGQWVHPAPREGPAPLTAEEEPESGTHVADEGDPTRLRAYQPGDPVRHIVFRHYAKTGRLVSRRPEGEPVDTEPVSIDYEQFRGSCEQRLSRMTALLFRHVREGRPWRLLLPGHPPVAGSAGPGGGDGARRQALQLLTRFGRQRDAQGYDAAPVRDESLRGEG
jgi:uncharacterized protein (DUF58 family)